jgi:hypothetical protein
VENWVSACYAQGTMRRPPETEEELKAEREKLLEGWKKIMAENEFTPKVPDEKPRED